MAGPITPAQLALCAVIELYLRKGEEGDSDEDELEVVQAEQRVRLGPLMTRVLQPGAAGDGGNPDLLGAEAKIVDVLALLQVRHGNASTSWDACQPPAACVVEHLPLPARYKRHSLLVAAAIRSYTIVATMPTSRGCSTVFEH